MVEERAISSKWSAYQDKLLASMRAARFYRPGSPENELSASLKRLATVITNHIDSGVKVRCDPEHVMYVWVDA